MGDALSLKLRKILNLSLELKPVWFKLLLPLFFLISFMISQVARSRRSQARDISLKNIEIKIICVGNILIGGTGKSPIVQKIAQEYLAQGFVVAIAARGITNIKKPVYVHQACLNEINLLSDENREHYEILKSKNLFVLQNKNRVESLLYFKSELKKINPHQKAVFILDDGLQHFSCPRDVNLCVWQPHLLLNSPHFCMPVGPYREGFGKNSFTKLLNSFHLRVWSRTSAENVGIFTKEIEQALAKYGQTLSNEDVIAVHSLKIVKITLKNNEYSYMPVTHADLQNISQNISAPVGVVAGIANPEAFMADLHTYLAPDTQFLTLFLADHARFQNSCSRIVQFMQGVDVCVLTLKDFFRWCDEPQFKVALENRVILGCCVELEFYNPITCTIVPILQYF
ncbi:MAG: tetraacyldisaccharide 4'-kinase [Bdellovibrionota bacterium]